MAAQMHLRASWSVCGRRLVAPLLAVCLIVLDGQAIDAQEPAYLIHAHLHIVVEVLKADKMLGS